MKLQQILFSKDVTLIHVLRNDKRLFSVKVEKKNPKSFGQIWREIRDGLGEHGFNSPSRSTLFKLNFTKQSSVRLDNYSAKYLNFFLSVDSCDDTEVPKAPEPLFELEEHSVWVRIKKLFGF